MSHIQESLRAPEYDDYRADATPALPFDPSSEDISAHLGDDYIHHKDVHTHRSNLGYSVEGHLSVGKKVSELSDEERHIFENTYSYDPMTGTGVYYDPASDSAFVHNSETGQARTVESGLSQGESPLIEDFIRIIDRTRTLDEAFRDFNEANITSPLFAMAVLNAIMNRFPSEETEKKVNEVALREAEKAERSILYPKDIDDSLNLEEVLEGMVFAADLVTDHGTRQEILESLEATTIALTSKLDHDHDTHHTGDLSDVIKQAVHDLMEAPDHIDASLSLLVEQRSEEHRLIGQRNALKQKGASPIEIAATERQIRKVRHDIRQELTPPRSAMSGVRELVSRLVSRP